MGEVLPQRGHKADAPGATQVLPWVNRASVIVLYAPDTPTIPQGDCAIPSPPPRADVGNKVGEIGVLDTNMRSVWLHDAVVVVYSKKLRWGTNLVPHPNSPRPRGN